MNTVLTLSEPLPPPGRRAAHEASRLAKRLRHQVGRAIADFGMIEAGDKVMVCLSGGKDSYTLLDILLQLQKKAPVAFSITAVNLDQKQPDFPEHVLPEYLQSIGVDYNVIEQDTYSVVTRVVPEGKTMCSLCSRLRRGALYAYAEAEGFTKIALGHHRDDLVATFFLNLFFHAKLSGMPPKLLSDDGKHVVIRPLAYVCEDDIAAYADAKQFPIIPCNLCGLFFHAKLSGMPPKLLSDDGKHVVIRPLAYVCEDDIAAYADAKQFPIIPCNLCGSQETLQRKQVKKMLDSWEHDTPGRIEQIARALGDIRPEKLSDPKLFDFFSLGKHGDDGMLDMPADAWLTGKSIAHMPGEL